MSRLLSYLEVSWYVTPQANTSPILLPSRVLIKDFFTKFYQVRLALSLILHSPPHLLVLDEITTHLDFYTVTAVVHALSAYEGAILLVSHDRFLIRCVISGELPDPEGDDSEDEGVAEEGSKALGRRSVVYELKNGKLLERSGGIHDFEESLEARVRKMMGLA